MINDKEILWDCIEIACKKAIEMDYWVYPNFENVLAHLQKKYEGVSLKQDKKRIIKYIDKMLIDFKKISNLIEKEDVSENNIILAKGFIQW